MSFDNGNESGMLMGGMFIKECKPDYEQQAAKQKKRLEATENLEDALFYFMSLNDSHRFRKISSLAEFIGGLLIVKKEQTNYYAEILSKIEKEK